MLCWLRHGFVSRVIQQNFHFRLIQQVIDHICRKVIEEFFVYFLLYRNAYLYNDFEDHIKNGWLA